MDEKQARALVMFLTAGMKVVSSRLVLFLGLLMTFGLFVWAMIQPDVNRIVTAAVFMLGVFWPVIRTDAKQNEARQREVPQGE